jgi:anti-sigma factor RsiW
MNCPQFRQILADYIAGELPPVLHGEAQLHAGQCRACADELAGLQSAAAVLDSGRLTDDAAERHSAAQPIEPRPRLVPPASPPQRSVVPALLRYAAAIAISFVTGYALRGPGAAPKAAEPSIVSAAAPAVVIERYNTLAREHPDAPSFSRSLLAVAAPARSRP